MQNNRNKLLEWNASEKITQPDLIKAVALVNAEPSSNDWLAFLKISFLWLGVISMSSGTIFFFAYNWLDMSRFTKFALIESAMLLSTIAYVHIAKTQRLTATMLMGMALLTGGLLALVGQTYQTGADPWQLFAIWSLLIIPWAIISRASSLWILWVALINLSLYLYTDINHGLFGLILSDNNTAWMFSLLNSVLLISFELGKRYQGVNRLGLGVKPALSSEEDSDVQGDRYTIQLVTLVAGIATTFLATLSIFERRTGSDGFIFYALWIAAIFYIYRFKIKDLLILSAASLSGIVVIVSVLINAIGNSLDEGGFLLISFAIIGLSTLAGVWLKKLAKAFAQEQQTDSDKNTEEAL